MMFLVTEMFSWLLSISLLSLVSWGERQKDIIHVYGMSF